MPCYCVPSIAEEQLRAAYPRLDENPAQYYARIEDVCRGFAEKFGPNRAVRLFSAPGRTEIGGNHTDHQHGCVLAASVDMDILCAAACNDDAVIRVYSEGFPTVEVDISDPVLRENEKNTSAALIRGIAARLCETGRAIGGFDAYAVSSVLSGSGLSSSAAYEVLIGTVLNGLYCGGAVGSIEIAQIGQYAENVYFGKPSGLMDQMASSVGGVVAIDFADNDAPLVRQIAFGLQQAGYALCIIDSGADHAALTPAYAAIPQEMHAVAAFFNKRWLREVDKQQLLDNLPAVRKEAGDRAVLRALHFFADNARAQREAELLAAGDFAAFLQTVRESGRSSFMYLQNVSVSGAVRQQEMAYTLALCDEMLAGYGAFRVHGGGFAGTVQAFVPLDMLDGFYAGMEHALAAGCCHVLSIRPAGGIELTNGR